MDSIGVHRPRNLDWKRAAALLYGDWGTSKAYVIGFAFSASFAISSYAALPIILAVSALTGLVAYNYVIICRKFPDGGGVYSSAREQSRFLAVMGALLLVANFTVTAAMSGWAAMRYFRVSPQWTAWVTIALIICVVLLNYFGPKHSGSMAVSLAVPMAIVVVLIVVWSIPHLSLESVRWPKAGFGRSWLAFTGMILALSGVEAIANLTGVMKLDVGSTMELPKIARTARKAIWPVAIEVVIGTSLLGWAMLSLPKKLEPVLHERWDDMLSVLAEFYASAAINPAFGKIFGVAVGVIVGLLLLSAVNTAIGALIGLMYMLARDGEMPKKFCRLNNFGVPWLPLLTAAVLPVAVVLVSKNLESLMSLYAIGVVGAITVNLGSCSFNKNLKLKWYERGVMTLTFLILLCVEITVAKTKPDALFFACCVLIIGFGIRAYGQRRAGLHTVILTKADVARVVPEALPKLKLNLTPGQGIMVAARGVTPVLKFALEEARLREGRLYVLFVKELAVTLPGPIQAHEKPRWQDDKDAAKIMDAMLELGRQHTVPIIPLYLVSEHPATTILDLAATLGIDIVVLGSTHRTRLVSLLKGNVVTEVAKNLPENIDLIIYG